MPKACCVAACDPYVVTASCITKTRILRCILHPLSFLTLRARCRPNPPRTKGAAPPRRSRHPAHHYPIIPSSSHALSLHHPILSHPSYQSTQSSRAQRSYHYTPIASVPPITTVTHTPTSMPNPLVPRIPHTPHTRHDTPNMTTVPTIPHMGRYVPICARMFHYVPLCSSMFQYVLACSKIAD